VYGSWSVEGLSGEATARHGNCLFAFEIIQSNMQLCNNTSSRAIQLFCI
jgi:hypothetical protein